MRPIASSPAVERAEAEPGRDRGRADKRERILDAAIKVFARRGYHGARVSDIAREAGIAYGLVYHYFKNKEEILHSIFDQRWGGFLAELEQIAGAETPARDKLAAVAALMLDAWRRNPDWMKVLVIEIQRSSRFAEPAQLEAVGELFRLVTRIVCAGQEAGELRAEVEPEVACYVFLGALEIAVTSRVLGLADARAGGDEEDNMRVSRSVVDVFLNGMAAEGGER